MLKGQEEIVSGGLFEITTGELRLLFNPQGTFSIFQATLNPWVSLGVHNPTCCGRGTGSCPAFSQYRQRPIWRSLYLANTNLIGFWYYTVLQVWGISNNAITRDLIHGIAINR